MTFYNEVTRLNDAIVLLDAKIEEFSREDRYKDKVDKLRCFAGIDTHVAMVMMTENSHFNLIYKRGTISRPDFPVSS